MTWDVMNRAAHGWSATEAGGHFLVFDLDQIPNPCAQTIVQHSAGGESPPRRSWAFGLEIQRQSLSRPPAANAQGLVAQPYEMFIVQPSGTLATKTPLFAVSTAQPLQVVTGETVRTYWGEFMKIYASLAAFALALAIGARKAMAYSVAPR